MNTSLAALAVLTGIASAQTPSFKVIYTFTGGADGAFPSSAPAIGKTGVLYGTAAYGGSPTEGAAFSLAPSASGEPWTFQTLLSFDITNGFQPESGVTIGANGTLYGTTLDGGTEAGVVYSLAPPAVAGGAWTPSVLLDFGPPEGVQPTAGVLAGRNGTLYGTTSNASTVFSLVPPSVAGGAWTPHVLHTFGVTPGDGATAVGGLVAGAGGALYGTTEYGGASGYGTVYRLTPPKSANQPWTEIILYSFLGAGSLDGQYPLSTLVFGTDGVLYGTTSQGGSCGQGCGTVFSLAPPSIEGGSWTESIIGSFDGLNNGNSPVAGVVFGKGGVLYGTTEFGGASNQGTVFALVPPASSGGPWRGRVVYSFTGGADGGEPVAALTVGENGVVYGTASSGGGGSANYCFDTGCGVVFALTP